jgi:hypothetical protein
MMDKVIIKNIPMKDFIGRLLIHSRHATDYVSNETGISENVDIKFDAIMGDFDDINKGLKKVGLKLQKGTKIMKTIVIRDKED